ncbi:sulfotransferase [Psychroserpens sp. XS_ASV72]|uniref:sulfotransferase family protein n=1 Tax=Psychroserpens sp. XS_ASV72 TaxID=3241293 RepID=UPI003517ED6E
MKVDFLLIGAAKSATTSLSSCISQHPDICFSNPKEPQFFDKTDWRNHLDSYHSLFNEESKLYGEGSTNYSKYPHCNLNIYSDIYEYNPEMKIIYIMRHPIERIVSQYTHAYNRGYDTNDDINKALMTDDHYINTGKYAMQIEPYIETFGLSNILLLFFGDFISNPNKVTNKVFRFLELQPFEVDLSVLNINKSNDKKLLHYKYDNPKTVLERLKKAALILKNYINPNFIHKKPQLLESTREYILNNCKNDIEKIEKLTQRDLSHWLR